MENFTVSRLQGQQFFSGLSEKRIQTMLDTGRIQTYRRKEPVFSDRERAYFVRILLSGQVSVYNLTRHGNRKIIFFLGQGHLLNHDIRKTAFTALCCEAVTEVQVLEISRADFLKFMEEDFSLTCAVLEEYERYLWRLTHQLKNTAGNMLTERKIAAKLWKLGRDFGSPCKDGIMISLPFTISLMADFAGVPRENASRACKRLAARGLLISRNRRFILPNPDGLAEFYKM